jgi:hypothetical protein
MSTTPTTPAASPLAIDADIKKFKSAIIDMDSLSQGGFSKISSIARLALAAMGGPQHPCQDDDIANALTAIRDIADDSENCINARAEEVGANYLDHQFGRRLVAAGRVSMADGVAA